jgi:hypothetical protein
VFVPKAQSGDPAPSTTTYPQGYGFGSVTVTASGIATLKGTLADGTMVTAAAPLSQSFQWPLFARLYGKGGSIAGMIGFEGSTSASGLKGLDLFWFRPALRKSKYYPGGWDGGTSVDLVGAAFSALDPFLPAGSLNFTGGKLTAPLTEHSYSLALNPTNGMIWGSFVHTDGIPTDFKGVILQHPVDAGDYLLNAGGYGFFLSTPLKEAGGTGESGGVRLLAP